MEVYNFHYKHFFKKLIDHPNLCSLIEEAEKLQKDIENCFIKKKNATVQLFA